MTAGNIIGAEIKEWLHTIIDGCNATGIKNEDLEKGWLHNKVTAYPVIEYNLVRTGNG
jgi:hypothetical protein